jgi:hypothetical protein
MGQQTGDEQNFSAPPLPHVLCENVGDGGKACDVQLHHRQCRVERSVGKRTLQSVPGVVDQDVNRNAPLAQPLLQSDDCRDIGKVNLLHNDLNPVLLAEDFSESLQPVQAARDQNQRMALFGVLAGELLAKATGCAGDENPGFVY